MSLVVSILIRLLDLFDLLLLIYVILGWVRIRENRWTVLLRSVVEPVLNPIRAFLAARWPRLTAPLDWSPVAAWVLLALLRNVLAWLV